MGFLKEISDKERKRRERMEYLIEFLIDHDILRANDGRQLYELELAELERLHIEIKCEIGRELSEKDTSLQNTDDSNLSLQLISKDWGQANLNPMVRAFGAIRDKKCIGCKHLMKHKLSKTYYKCGLRTVTNGPSTDHKAHWIACSKYEGK